MSTKQDKKTRAQNGLVFIQKSPAVQSRIEASVYEGKNYINIRDWVKRKGDNEYRPTPKGMTVSPEHWEAFQAMIADFEPNFEQGESKKERGGAQQMYAIFESGEKELPEKELLKSFQHCVDSGLALSSLDKSKPTKGMVVYAAKVESGKVQKVKRYATCMKKDDKRQWVKL